MSGHKDHKNCELILGNLSAYLDGEASAALCAEIERHLSECDDCQVVVDTLRRTISLYRTLPPSEMPDALRKRLYKTLDLEQFLPRDDG
jgi:anti-sigma factor RsiW